MVTHCSLWRAVIAISVTGAALSVCNPGLIVAQEGHWVEGFGVPGMNGTNIWDLIEYGGVVIACGDFRKGARGVVCVAGLGD